MKNFITAGIALLASSLLYAEYERSNWGSFYDSSAFCKSTRMEVIRDERVSGIIHGDDCSADGVAVYDPYTGTILFDVNAGDVDHLVPLKEAYRSGGASWTKERKKEYANDLSNENHLILVHRSANRSKSDKDPARWIPSNLAYLGEYLDNWELVKVSWNLTYDAEEKEAIQLLRELSTYTCRKGIKLNGPEHIRKILDAIKDK